MAHSRERFTSTERPADLGRQLAGYVADLNSTAPIPYADRVAVVRVSRLGNQGDRPARLECRILESVETVACARDVKDYGSGDQLRQFVVRDSLIGTSVMDPVATLMHRLTCAIDGAYAGRHQDHWRPCRSK